MYQSCTNAIDSVLKQEFLAKQIVRDHVVLRVRHDLDMKHQLEEPVAKLIADLPACDLLDALYSVSIMRHHISNAMSIARSKPVYDFDREARFLAACRNVLLNFHCFDDKFRNEVGNVMYAEILNIVGLRVGKVTGMLVDLPIAQLT